MKERPFLVRSLLLGASAGMGWIGACHSDCEAPYYDERTATGEVRYVVEGVTTRVDLADRLELQATEDQRAYERLVVEERLAASWEGVDMNGKARAFTLTIDGVFEAGEAKLEDQGARLCACPREESGLLPRCDPEAGGSAVCESLSGTIRVLEIDEACASTDATRLCDEDVDVVVEVPDADGKSFSGTMHFRSSMYLDSKECDPGCALTRIG